jgi:predicted hotdog family 3-hydroxylacyl-ACP dehydratase
MIADKEDIVQLIPQRQPFIMLDQLVQADQMGCRSCFKIAEGNIFLEDGVMLAPGLIENIAQTAAARVGYICREENRPPPIGYIGAIQNLEIKALPKINDQIETEISIKNQIFDVTIISGEARCKGMLLASCEMKIFISNQP